MEGSKRVAVTGAGGKLGSLVFMKLLGAQPTGLQPVGVVRSEQSREQLLAKCEGLPGAAAPDVRIADIAAPDAAQQLQEAFSGCEALIVCTSAVPEPIPGEVAPNGWPKYRWKGGQTPEMVDYAGQVTQFNAAKAAGMRRVVLVSSMGGTDSKHPLNAIGEGNILQWKRKAEQALLSSGLAYTIVHPGHLVEEPGHQRRLLLGVNDDLVKADPAFRNRIPREDVARFCIACLNLDEARNRSIDLTAQPPAQPPPLGAEGGAASGLNGDSTNGAVAFEPAATAVQDDPIACHVASLAEARALLLQCQDDCDYSINSQA